MESILHRDAALDGVVVIDLSRVFAGPYCTMMLGDLGATVIKVEHPDGGDDTRCFGPPFVGGESSYYLGLNRNKWSITLDFSTPEGRERLLHLIKEATVLVENFRPGVLARKGLDYETLGAINPGLIYCSIHGYGAHGPEAQQPGYDLVAQAESGFMSIIGEADGDPLPVGVPIIDLTTGMYACLSILAALRVRDQTGMGQQVSVSLHESAITLLSDVASSYLATGKEPVRYGNGHPILVPYQSFQTQTRSIVIACGNDRLYARFCSLLGHEELITDPRFLTNTQRVEHRAELIPLLQEVLLQRDALSWLHNLQAAGIPCALVQTVGEMFHHPQTQASGIVWECEHPTAGKIQLVGSPLHLSQTPTRLYKVPPLLGEHNRAVLAEHTAPLAF